MNKKSLQKPFLRIFVIFIAVDVIAMALGSQLDAINIGHLTLIGANALLFAMGCAGLVMNARAINNSNPNVFTRSIMGGTFLKIMVIIAALAVYMVAAGKNKSIGAVLCGMGLYVVYTLLEVRAALQLNSGENGNK